MYDSQYDNAIVFARISRERVVSFPSDFKSPVSLGEN